MLTTSKLLTFWRERLIFWCKRPSYSVKSLSTIIIIFFYKVNQIKSLHLFMWTLNVLRQEVQLRSDNLINGKFFIYYYFFYNMPMYPTNKSSSVTQNIEAYTLKSHVIPNKSCANVLVLEQIKHVNSQLPKVTN